MRFLSVLTCLFLSLSPAGISAQDISGPWSATISFSQGCEWQGIFHFTQTENPGAVEGVGDLPITSGSCSDVSGLLTGTINGSALEFAFPVDDVVEAIFIANVGEESMSGTWSTVLVPSFGGEWSAVRGPGNRRGPFILRYEQVEVIYLVSNGLVAIHGFDVVGGICDGGDLYTDVFQYKDIDNPGVWPAAVSQMKGKDIDTWIYPESVFVPTADPLNVDWPSTCAILQGNPELAIATGPVKIVRTENSKGKVAGAEPTLSQRSKSLHLSAHGILRSPSLERVTYSGSVRCISNVGPGPEDSSRCHTSIRIQD